MNEYRVLMQGVQGVRKLYPIDQDIYDLIDVTKDWYESIFIYTDVHKKQLEETASLAGIRDVTTEKLIWDLDSSNNLQQALEDTRTLVHNLFKEGINYKDISIAFSGKKGFSIVLNTNQRFTVDEFKAINIGLGENLKTNDTTVADPQRIFRVIGTKHNKSEYYKYPLTVKELFNLNIDEIKSKALDIETADKNLIKSNIISVPNSILDFKTQVKEVKLPTANLDINYSNKMKGWSNCKWALLNGYEVKQSDRHNKLLCIISTSRALNTPKSNAYYNAKNAMKLGVDLYGGEECPKEDIWRDVESVYSDNWKGGTFSCKDGNTPWLTSLCKSLGPNGCKHNDVDTVTATEVFSMFEDYALNYEKNIIQTGITALDRRCKFMVGTSNGILAPPSVGKSSLAFDILNHNSNNGTNCIFFSYDMFHSMVYLRLIQKHFNIDEDKIFQIFKHDKPKAQIIKKTIEEQYKNIKFCFKSGQNPDEIYETILDTEQFTGNKVKLCIYDYNELIQTPYSDSTQSSAYTAQRLRQIANDTSTCSICLLQPSKLYSNPADEIATYQGAKGSGAIAQSMSLMLSLSRPGFSARSPENDKYFTINALKHRHGSLFTLDLGWNGLTGKIRDLTEEEKLDLERLREEKKMQQSNSDGW